MRSHLAIAWLLAAAPFAALAQQEVPGLDLNAPPKQPPADGDDKAKGEELPPLDLAKPAQPPASSAPSETKKEARPERPFSEKDVALGDKVKAVQRKGFLRRGRVEVTPMFAMTANDAYYQKFGGGLRVGYNFQDSFELAIRGTTYTQMRTDNVREGKMAFQSQLLNSELYRQAMADAIWSPVYGKAAFLGHSIVHFDLFLTAGFGAVWTATSDPPMEQGPHLATELGGGVRFNPRDWMAFEVGLLATFYPDQTVSSLPATTQRVFVANVGVSFFWPFSFEYVYP